MRTTQQWSRLPREAVLSQSLEVVKTRWDSPVQSVLTSGLSALSRRSDWTLPEVPSNLNCPAILDLLSWLPSGTSVPLNKFL